jgi:GntR family transcriptional regulator, transcriptional repressor for pyruvate dehydrogenase complex
MKKNVSHKTILFPTTEEKSLMTPRGFSYTLFQPIKKKRTFEEVSGEIKKLIFKGVLKPGNRLPSEIELARQFSVGRQTIREAMRLLELNGFITIQRGVMGGAVVSDTILDALGRLILDSFLMRKVTIDEVASARLEIERVILRNVFEHVSSADIELLKENVLKAKRKAENRLGALDEHVQFHKLLARASGNQVFVIVMESIMIVLANFLRPLEQDLERTKRMISFHENILNAIIDKKVDEALVSLEEDLLLGRNSLVLLHNSQSNGAFLMGKRSRLK